MRLMLVGTIIAIKGPLQLRVSANDDTVRDEDGQPTEEHCKYKPAQPTTASTLLHRNRTHAPRSRVQLMEPNGSFPIKASDTKATDTNAHMWTIHGPASDVDEVGSMCICAI